MSAVALGLLVERARRRRGRRPPSRSHRQVIGVVAVPVEQHVADVELVGLRGGLHVVGPAAGGSASTVMVKDAVGVECHGAAVEHGDGAHVGVPEREVVLGHPVLADPAVDLVALVAGDGDDPVDAVGIVDPPT